MGDNELVKVATVGVTTAMDSIMNRFQSTRMIRKQEFVVLEEKIRVFRASARQQGGGEVNRVGIDEFVKTLRMIQELKLEAPEHASVMELLKIQYEGAKRNLEEYTRV